MARKEINKQKTEYELDLLYKIVEKMKNETKKWSGNYIFVYVPTWSRYFTKYTKYDAKIDLKDEIIQNLKKKNINILDLTDFFDKTENMWGMDIVICTSANTNEEAKALLTEFNMPFTK